MAAAERFTFDPVVEDDVVVSPATRPSLEDVGGARFEDDPNFPPPKDGKAFPYADLLNQLQQQVAAVSRMAPSARLTIDFAAGAPYVAKIATMSTLLTADDFELTDNGTGDTTITWASGMLPAVECDPMFSLHRGALSGVLVGELTTPTPTSVRLLTRDDGVAADMRFTVAIF